MTAGTDLSSPWADTVPPQDPLHRTVPRRFAPPVETPPREMLGGWWRRVLATLLDGVLALVLLTPVLGLVALAAAASDGAFAVAAILGYVAYVGVVAWQLVRQGRSGATYGKELLGLRLVGELDGRPVGAWLSIGRAFVHILDTLPLYLGYLLPVVDRKRQTITDKAMKTLVLRVPRSRPPLPIVAVALALAGLLMTGSFVALAETAPPLEEPAAQGPTIAELLEDGTLSGEAPSAAPAGPLPAEDTAGRIAPPAPGYDTVPDDVSELGALDVDETAALGGATGEEAAGAKETLLSYGLIGSYGQAFDTRKTAYVVVVYRFPEPGVAGEFAAAINDSVDSVQPTSVPGARVYDASTEELGGLSASYSSGSFVYEVTLLAEGTPAPAEFESLLVRQYEHSQRTG